MTVDYKYLNAVGSSNQSHSHVASRFNVAEQWANTSLSLSQDYMNKLTNFVSNLSLPDASIDITAPTITSISYSNRASLGSLALDTSLPENTATVDLKENRYFTPPSIPTKTFQPPPFSTPDTPSQSQIPEPGNMPSLNSDITLPTAPSITLPTPPSFEEITIPNPPDITLPELDASLPDKVFGEPVAMSWEPAPYNSDIWSDLLSKVLTDIREGGTGLDVVVEQELYDRALSRQQNENDRLYQEVEDKLGSKGFDLPNGALTSALLQVSNQVTRNNTEINGQITIDQAKLAQDNTHFVLDKGVQLAGMIDEFFHQQEARRLDASKSMATISIEAYNARVNQFNSMITRYQADTQAFEARTKTALIDLEIFKGQIESAKLSVDTQNSLASLYNSQLAAVETQRKLYALEVDTAKSFMDIEKNKIGLFQAEVQSYIGRLEGEKAKFDLYSSQLKGEEIKADVFKTQVSAYSEDVKASSALADIQVAEAEINAKDNAVKIEKYKADLQQYLSEVDFKAKNVAMMVDGFKAEAVAYEAETGADRASNNAKIAEMELLVSKYKADIGKAAAEIEATTNSYIALAGLREKAVSGTANMGAQLASSAMNTVNTSASLGYSSSQSLGFSTSSNVSKSESSSMSEVHSYDETVAP